MCFVLTFSIENVNNLNEKKQEFIRGNLKQTYHHQMKNKKKEIVAKKTTKIKPFNEHLLNVFNVKKTETK